MPGLLSPTLAQSWGHQIFIPAPQSRQGGDRVSELTSSPRAALCVPGPGPSPSINNRTPGCDTSPAVPPVPGPAPRCPSIKLSAAGDGHSSHCPGSNSSWGWKAGQCSALRVTPAHTLAGVPIHSCSEPAVRAQLGPCGGFGVQPPGELPKQGYPCAPTGKGVMAAVPAHTGSSGWGHLLLQEQHNTRAKERATPAHLGQEVLSSTW